MAGGVRFDNDFLAKQAAKRQRWNRKGVKAGHGGSFSLDFADPYAGQPGKGKGKSKGRASVVAPAEDYFQGAAGMDTINVDGLPDWLVDIIKSDGEIKRALVEKGYSPESPHKQALALVAKDITLLNGRPATADKKARRGNPEHYLQVRIFYMLEKHHPEVYYFTKAVPNGGHRAKSTAGQMKAEGQKPGAPDIDIELPRGRYHGMKLEVKTESGSLQANQKERLAKLNEIGFYAVVGKGFDECWQLILNYIQLPAFDNMTEISGINASN